MIAAAVFEEVTSLPESLAGGHPDGVAWGEAHRRVPAGSGMLLGIESFLAGIESFDLPRPSGDAAGRADGLPVVLLETASPDGAVGFSLHDRGMREYWLEVSLAPSNRPPAVVALRYGTVSQGQQDLLIPVDDDGSGLPSSVVSLPGYAIGATWRAWPALPHDSLGTWPDEVVARSVRAAITVATAQAWERLACAVPPDTGQVITRELRAIRGSR